MRNPANVIANLTSWLNQAGIEGRTHASAPAGYKCADCSIDGSPCLECRVASVAAPPAPAEEVAPLNLDELRAIISAESSGSDRIVRVPVQVINEHVGRLAREWTIRSPAPSSAPGEVDDTLREAGRLYLAMEVADWDAGNAQREASQAMFRAPGAPGTLALRAEDARLRDIATAAWNEWRTFKGMSVAWGIEHRAALSPPQPAPTLPEKPAFDGSKCADCDCDHDPRRQGQSVGCICENDRHQWRKQAPVPEKPADESTPPCCLCGAPVPVYSSTGKPCATLDGRPVCAPGCPPGRGSETRGGGCDSGRESGGGDS